MTGPLEGVRVIELAGIGPGPFAGMMLADMGADVVRVERPNTVPLVGVAERDLLNRGKRSIALDLKTDRDRQVLLDLVSRAEILVEGYRPGVAERLGVGPDDCWAVNPALVYGRMTGWGQDGPLAQTAGHDLSYIAVTGVLHAIGRAGGPPQIPLNIVGDFGGGANYLVMGLLAALIRSRAGGQGQVVDAAIVDGTAHLATMAVSMLNEGIWRDERGVNLIDSGRPYYDVYRTGDGEYLAVASLEPQFHAELIDGLGIEDVPDRDDPTDAEVLRRRISEVVATRTVKEWSEIFEGSDACVSPVLSFREAFDHPHLRARGTYVEHCGVVQPAPAPRFSHTPASLRLPPPVPGAHTDEVLEDWGVSDTRQAETIGSAEATPSVRSN
jgi:alpha-methylacyl-CoA racemase